MTNKVAKIAQYILGIVLVVFGLNGFLQFIPLPAPSEAAGALAGAMAAAGYIFPLVMIILLLTGILFLINRYVALGLLLLAPVSVNIVLFHLFLDPAGIVMGAIVFILNAYLGWEHWNDFKPIFQAKHNH